MSVKKMINGELVTLAGAQLQQVFTGTEAEIEAALQAGTIPEGALINSLDDGDDPELTSSMILHGNDSVENVLNDIGDSITQLSSDLSDDMTNVYNYFIRHSKAYQNANVLYNGQFSQGDVITLSDSTLNYEGLRIQNSNGGSSYVSNASPFTDIHANTFALVGSTFVMNLLVLRVVPNTNYTQFTVLVSAQVNLESTGITYFNTAAGDATWDIYGLSHTLVD